MNGWGWPMLVVAGIVGGLLIATVFLTAAGQATIAAYGFTGQTAASWAQAIVGITAIGAGAFAVRWEVQRNEKHRIDEKRESVCNYLTTLWSLAFTGRCELTLIEGGTSRNEPTKILLYTIDMLKAINVFDLPDASASLWIRSMLSSFDEYRADVEIGLKNRIPLAVRPVATRDPNPAARNAALENFSMAERALAQILLNKGGTIPDATYTIDNRTLFPLPPSGEK